MVAKLGWLQYFLPLFLHNLTYFVNLINIFDRPGVAGAVLQAPLWLINSLSKSSFVEHLRHWLII